MHERGASLRQTRLDRRRQMIRRSLLRVTLGLVVCVMVLLVLEDHKTKYSEWHSIRSEYFMSVVGIWGTGGLLLGLLALALRFGFVMGIVAGAATVIGAGGMLLSIVVVHLFLEVTHSAVGHLMQLGCLVLGALGPAIVIVEICLRVRQRRELGPRPLPQAVVVER